MEDLKGSIFNDYTIPRLSLLLIIGGSTLLAAVMLIQKSKFSILFSIGAGTIIILFEFVEVLIIGSPTGTGWNLQIFYFGLGIVIVILSLSAGFIDLITKDMNRSH